MIPMTVHGVEKLRHELEKLKTVERPNIIAAISEARSHGDLKENAEYHAARERQSFCEGRIKDLESKLSRAQVIDITRIANSGRVIFGTTVTLKHHESGAIQHYRIVGDDEADIKHSLISVNSPIARGLIGKRCGERVVIQTPNGEVEYTVLAVEHL